MNPVRFWSKVVRVAGKCWQWMGAHTDEGYGICGTHRRQFKAHRVAYELTIGPIPDGLQIDHLCRNRGCVNPEHMEPVTSRENTLRGEGPTAQLARATACIHGHPFTVENTHVGNGKRKCRTCHRALALRRYHENAEVKRT